MSAQFKVGDRIEVMHRGRPAARFGTVAAVLVGITGIAYVEAQMDGDSPDDPPCFGLQSNFRKAPPEEITP